MDFDLLLADISRSFFKERKVFRYRTRKVCEMSDQTVIRACHWYCEENGLTDAFASFRQAAMAHCRFCDHLKEYIDEDDCSALQMAARGDLPLAALPLQVIDPTGLQVSCSACRYAW